MDVVSLDQISKSCEAVLQKPDGATSTGIPTCVAVATRRPQEAGGSKIVVEEKCDTTVSVVPALSVLNASSQPIPVGIAVAQQRQDHTITCSKTSLSSSAAEQSHITAVSCSTVILAAGGSDRGPRLCESRQGPAAHQGMAETTTTCLVTAGPVPAHTTWDSHSDALAIRPAAAALPWLTTPAPPVVTTPTIWLPQEATPPPLASPGGFPTGTGRPHRSVVPCSCGTNKLDTLRCCHRKPRAANPDHSAAHNVPADHARPVEKRAETHCNGF
ncbi:hypothetical protein MRX96_022553 [Rhipicephalus microplus]